MPQKVSGNPGGRYVPFTARMSCYHCGMLFPSADSKLHCEMCYDIFCAKCRSKSLSLIDTMPGVRSTLAVCVSCSFLCGIFPSYLRGLSNERGGQLLPENYHGKITIFPSSAPVRRASGLLGPKFEVHETNIVLLAWRPLNPQTSLFLGPGHTVSLCDITDIDFTPQQMCRIEVKSRMGYGIQIFGGVGSARQDNLSTHALCAALQALLEHTEDHFAFSKAALGIHPDLCPVTDSFKHRTLSVGRDSLRLSTDFRDRGSVSPARPLTKENASEASPSDSIV